MEITKEEWVALVEKALEAAAPGLPRGRTHAGAGGGKARVEKLSTILGVGVSTIFRWRTGRMPRGLALEAAVTKMRALVESMRNIQMLQQGGSANAC